MIGDPSVKTGTPASGDVVDVAVLGGGIAGLTAAFAAHQQGWSVRLVESSRTLGGKMRTERRDGYLIEWGPNSFLGSASMLWRLVDAVKLGDEVVPGLPPGDRYIYRGRRARKLPSGPGEVLSGDYMTLRGKLRLLAEPFVPGDAKPGDTVMDFARRRLGEEAAQYLVTPFISGVYAGDPAQLGARDTFPKLWQWEHDAGSVTLGAMLGWSMRRDTAEKSEAAPVRRGMFSFREGMGSLVRAMADRLPAGSIHARSVADALEPQPDGTYLVRYHDAHDPTMTSEVRARRVIIALPPRATGALLQPTVAPTAEVLTSVDLCRVAVVHFGGPDPEGIAPKGFGVLIPPGEGLRTLGILMPSSVFPERAPAGHWLHTGFVGGAGDPDAADLTDETLLNLVRRAQQHAFGHHYPGRQLECNFHAVVRWRDAIPQYRPGHRDAMAAALAAVESHLPGVTLAGNYLAGVSVNDAAQSGWDAASRLATVKAGATSLQGAR